MKKFLRFSLLALLMTVFNGAWAAETPYKTLQFGSDYNSQGVSSYSSSWSATYVDFTCNIENFNNNNNQWSFIKGGSKNNDWTGTITTDAAIDKAVTKVVVTVGAVKNSNGSLLEVADNADFTNATTVSLTPVLGDNTYTITSPIPNAYYRLTFNQKKGSNNGELQISKIVFYTESGKEEAGIAFNPATITITQGDNEFDQPTFSNPHNLNVTFESNNEEVAMWDDQENALVLMDGIGTAVITATFAGNDSYLAGTATLTVTVEEEVVEPVFADVVIGSGRYQKVQSADELEAGKRYLIVYEGTEDCKVFSGMASGNYGTYVTLTAEDNIIDNNGDGAGTPVVLQEGNNDKWYMMLGESFLAYTLPIGTEKNNSLFVVDSWSTDGTQWMIDATSVTNAYNNARKLQYNTSSPRFACYTGSQADVTLYKEMPVEPVTVTISKSTYATFYYETKSFEIPEGVTASTVVKNGSSLDLTNLEGVIPAGVPVVLHAAAGDYDFVETSSTATFTGANDLKGSEEGGRVGDDGAKYYVLCWKDENMLPEELGFYWFQGSGGAYAYVNAHRAYLRLEANGANDAGFTFGEATGITSIAADSTDSAAPMYNLAGQRVDNNYRGVVIQNGMKKVKK